MSNETKAQQPAFARVWGRVSRRLVPILAVVTALIVTAPFMIITGARGSVTRGLQIAGTAYAALLEGALGIAINDLASPDDFDLVLQLTEIQPLEIGDAGSLARRVEAVDETGIENALRLGNVLSELGLESEAVEELSERITDIQAITPDNLTAMAPLIAELDTANRGEVRTLAEPYRRIPDALSAEARAAIESYAPSAADYADDELMAHMQRLNEYGVVRLGRLITALDTLAELNIDPFSDRANAIVEAGAANPSRILENFEAAQWMQDAGIENAEQLSVQLRLLDNLEEEGFLTASDVVIAIQDELPQVAQDNLLVRRPGNRILFDRRDVNSGIIYDDQNTPEDITDDQPDTVYLRLGGSAFMFFPPKLEVMIVRSIPFVIAGLAVALGFKAGLFNIGAEGQLYAGSVFAVYVGYSIYFQQLPTAIHVPLVVLVGILGGLLYGAIPGALKAYTGAHEVITTIMLNFIAIRLVDWLVKTEGLMLDPTSQYTENAFYCG